jgi:signal transduction histidine kinase
MSAADPHAEIPRPKVLYVDDQKGNLAVLAAHLRKHCEVHTADSGEEGLAILAKEEHSVVISDQKMPGLSGTGFLAEVRRRHPDAARILLTAYTDFDDMVAAINEGQVGRFISKPWEPAALLAAVVEANDNYWRVKNDRARAEHRERLAAIGQVTSGLVHELSNISAVLGVVEDIRAQWPEGHPVPRELSILKTGVDKFVMLVESLRVYSRGGNQLKVEKTREDLARVVSSAMVLLRLFPAVKELRSLELAPPASPVYAEVDSKKLQQVLVNVMKNAAEACPSLRGVVDVSIEKKGDVVEIRVKDNGSGISDEAARLIWGGFYSTKGDKGTGIGLAMSRMIMRAHDGDIAFQNNPDGGCTFVLTLPAA